MESWLASEKSYYQDISAWLSLVLAVHRLQLRGVRRKSVVVIRSAPNAACLSADTATSQAQTS